MKRRFVGVYRDGRPERSSSTPLGFPPGMEGVTYAESESEFVKHASEETDLLVLSMHGGAWGGEPIWLGTTREHADIAFSELELKCRFLVLVICHQQDSDASQIDLEGAQSRARRWAATSGAERIIAHAASMYTQPAAVAARRVWENEASWSSNELMLSAHEGRRPHSLMTALPYAWDKSGVLHHTS